MTYLPATRWPTIRWKVSLLLFAAFPCASPVYAQELELQQCLRIADMAERVACYDSIARAQQAQQGASALAPVSPDLQVPQAAAPAVPDRRREFGLSAAEREEARRPQARQLDEITAVIASSKTVGAGYWQFTTTEGSAWRLAETSRSFRPPRVGDGVRIRRGRLGSYYLDADKQPSMRVVRID